MQVSGAGVMESIAFQYHPFGHAGNGGHDATGTREISFAKILSLVNIAYLDDSPVYLSIETSAQPLTHVSQVHVLIVYLAQVGVVAEVLVGGKGCAKLNGFGHGHVSLYALGGGSARDDTYLEGMASVVLGDGSLGEFPEDSFWHPVGRKAAQGDIVLVLDHGRPLGGGYSGVSHFVSLLSIDMVCEKRGQRYKNIYKLWFL
jgi:hypothetical protein